MGSSGAARNRSRRSEIVGDVMMAPEAERLVEGLKVASLLDFGSEA